MKLIKVQYKIAAVIALVCLAPALAKAAPLPGAGAISRELDQERHWMPTTKEPEVDVSMAVREHHDADVRFHLQKLVFTGQDIFTQEQLQAVVQEYIGQEVDFRQLQDITVQIGNFLHDQGYMTALAYLPEQEIVDGVVAIDIIIGTYGDVGYDNQSEIMTGRVQGLAHAVRGGKLIEKHPMNRLLLIINDIPGVRAHAFLVPGREPGTADANFQVTTTEKRGGVLYTDNYGNRYTGRYRFGGSYHWNNLSHVGDQLQVGYLTSNGDLENYDFKYELPVGNYGTFAGIAYSKMNYELGENYRPLYADGIARTWQLFTRTPLKRTLNNNLYLKLRYEYRDLVDRINYFSVDTRKGSRVFRIGLDGDYRNNAAASTYKLTHSMGEALMKSPDARLSDAYGTEGYFQKTELDLYRMQRLSAQTSLHLSLSGQYAWDNLDSSEDFYIGGYNAVRAYPQGEAGGDIGVLGTAELRCDLGRPNLQAALFADIGWTRYNKDSLGLGGERSRILSGAGIGLIWLESKRSYMRLDYAVPLSDRYSSNEGKDLNGRFWYQYIHMI